jgi:MoaA/NifB/PqqE/SkfB family radical SAM enzyme
VRHELESELGFSRDEIASCVARGGLLSLELEFTRRCNLRCVYCYASAGEAGKGELSLEELQDVVEQAARMGARRIVLLGGGEPLLFPELPALVRHIDALGLSQALFTNGIPLTPALCRFLFDHRVAVAIKQNSRRPGVQDGLAGVAGAYHGIQRGLRLLQEAGYPGPERPLCVQSVICRQNREEIPAMWVWARERRITPYFEVLTDQGRARQHPDLHLSLAETRTVFDELARIDRERFGAHWIPRPPIAGFSCRRHLYSCLVTTRGDVQPCPGVDVCVGSIRRQPLPAILRESRVIRELRAIHGTAVPGCVGCRFAGECYGCRGNAYQHTGNYLAEDPSCWLRANGTNGAASHQPSAISDQPRATAD